LQFVDVENAHELREFVRSSVLDAALIRAELVNLSIIGTGIRI
jgi:hypothetical protein